MKEELLSIYWFVMGLFGRKRPLRYFIHRVNLGTANAVVQLKDGTIIHAFFKGEEDSDLDREVDLFHYELSSEAHKAIKVFTQENYSYFKSGDVKLVKLNKQDKFVQIKREY